MTADSITYTITKSSGITKNKTKKNLPEPGHRVHLGDIFKINSWPRNKWLCVCVISWAVYLNQANRSHYHLISILTLQSIQPSIMVCVCVCFLSSSVPCACWVMTNDALRGRHINPVEGDSRAGEVSAWISVHTGTFVWAGEHKILSINQTSVLQLKGKCWLRRHNTTRARRAHACVYSEVSSLLLDTNLSLIGFGRRQQKGSPAITTFNLCPLICLSVPQHQAGVKIRRNSSSSSVAHGKCSCTTGGKTTVFNKSQLHGYISSGTFKRNAKTLSKAIPLTSRSNISISRHTQ